MPGNEAKQVPSLPFVVCPQGDRVETYRELEIVLHGNNSFLTSGAVNRLIAEASRDMRAAQVSCFSFKATKQPASAPGFGEIESGTEMFLGYSEPAEVLRERLWVLVITGNLERGCRELRREADSGLFLTVRAPGSSPRLLLLP